MKKKAVFFSLIAGAVALAMAFGVMWATGVFSGGAIAGELKRPYILADERFPAPRNLNEYLNTEDISLDNVLANGAFTADLLNADTLQDVVDSRLSLSNLRILQKEAAERVTSAQTAFLTGLASSSSAFGAAQLSSPTAPVQPNAAALSAEPEGVQGLLQVKQKLDVLLTKEQPVIRAIEAQVDLKAVWTKPDDVLLHWTPHGTWVPENGYDLYRTINGNKELLAENLGSMEQVSNVVSGEYAAYIKPIFDAAALTADKLATIGLKSAGEFNALVYQASTAQVIRPRITGEKDFAYLRGRALAIPATLEEKLPETDVTQQSAVLTASSAMRSFDASLQREFNSTAALSVLPLEQIKSYAGGDAARVAAIDQILGARQMIMAKAFVDSAFAADAGLGYHDSLAGLKLPEGTPVTYTLEAASGSSWACTVKTGEETLLSKPSGLDGYGMDNAVSLRWAAPVGGADKSLISGYYIERRKQGELNYKRLTAEPVAISYSLDETGIYFEVPVFYQDTTLANGEKASYRIQSLDLFGRKSEYCDPLEIEVYKVTAPCTPYMGQPALTTQQDRGIAGFATKLLGQKNARAAIALYVNATSEDTHSVVFYRAEALGTGLFDAPVEIGRVELNGTPLRDGKKAEASFYDTDVRPGYYYKYWAASVDDWGNESVWSTSRIVGVPDPRAPQGPGALSINFTSNDLKDLLSAPPGFGVQIIDDKTYEASKAPNSSNSLKEYGIIGLPLSQSEGGNVPGTLSSAYGNLPDPNGVQALIALEGSDLLPNGSAKVVWTPYSGEGVTGYHVYRAEVDGKALSQLQGMSREEIIGGYIWKLAASGVEANQLTDATIAKKEGRIYLYLICPVFESAGSGNDALENGAAPKYAIGGWVHLSWAKPEDPQAAYFRVYRSEVTKNTQDADPDTLPWTLVADHNKYTGYTEKVDQTYAHYYVYRVATVSVWGVESIDFALMSFRVPSTSPPQTPSMLMPLAQSGKVQVNFTGVPHASKYGVYRTTLPDLSEADIVSLEKDYKAVYNTLFVDPLYNDSFLSKRMTAEGKRNLRPEKDTPLILADKLNTLQQADAAQLALALSEVSAESKLKAFQFIADQYGPLALAPYGDLSEAAANLVLWEKIGEVSSDESLEQPASFQYVDSTAVYGRTYLYTVQAENDDGLASARPAPVSASPRRGKPFDPVTGLNGKIVNGKPNLAWGPAVDATLGWEESRRDIAGYIVYRSDNQDGVYHQVSPLLEDVRWADERADPAAFNWYKVKVVDTAGYLSEFSSAVLVKGEPEDVGKLSAFTPPRFASGREMLDSYDTVSAGGFVLTGVKLGRSTGAGTGFLSIGLEEQVEVNLKQVTIIGGRMVRGEVSLKQTVYLPKEGLTLIALHFSGEAAEATVSGFLNRPAEAFDKAETNLLGGLYGLKFIDASITPNAVLTIADMPGFTYGNLHFEPSKNARIVLNATDEPFIRLSNGRAAYYPDVETIDCGGLSYRYTELSFDGAGRLSGKLQLTDSPVLRLVVPAGLGLKTETSTLTFKGGSVQAEQSSLKGKIILPFTSYSDTSGPLEISDAPLSGGAAAFDKLMPASGIGVSALVASLSKAETSELDASLAYLAYRVQRNALTVLPEDPQQQKKYSTISFNLSQWGGNGFTIASASMTPCYIGNCAGDTAQSLGLTPGKVSVDLERSASVASAPEDAQDIFWMGIVINDGTLSLPVQYVKDEAGKRMSFDLKPGEMLYSLNGFSYQNVASGAVGAPANFGDSLGGFQDVFVYGSMIDMYASRFSLEMDAEIGLPILGYQRVKTNLYTSKDTGELQCTVAATDYLSLSDPGNVKVKITGGCLRSDGMHLNGLLSVDFTENRLKFEDAAFNELIIPADPEKMSANAAPGERYGSALLEKPMSVKFHGFNMEVRSMSLVSIKRFVKPDTLGSVYKEGLLRSMQAEGQQPYGLSTVMTYGTELELIGATQLSDIMTMDTSESSDSIVVGDITGKPAIVYGDSKSHMHFVFSDYLTFDGDVAPDVDASDEDIVYYDFIDKMDMLFNSISDYKGYPVEANGRIGYDRKRDRYFFALGSYLNDETGEGVNIYYGHINQICGILAYNMDLEQDDQGRFTIPKDSAAMFSYVDSIPVSTSENQNCFYASACNIYLTIISAGEKIKVCEIRDVYLLAEWGPTIESGGDFYGPFDLKKLVKGDGFSYAGPGYIGYYHQDKRYQASTSLIEQPMYTLHVSGDMGIEISPDHFDVRLGYPNPMVARTDYELTGKFGIHFRGSHWSFIEAQAYFAYDTGVVPVTPEVYVRGNIGIGANGEYDFEDEMFLLAANVNGGVEGGLYVLKKKFPIIHLWLDSMGQIDTKDDCWTLHGKADIHYSLDLWIHDFEGTVTWNYGRVL